MGLVDVIRSADWWLDRPHCPGGLGRSIVHCTVSVLGVQCTLYTLQKNKYRMDNSCDSVFGHYILQNQSPYHIYIY